MKQTKQCGLWSWRRAGGPEPQAQIQPAIAKTARAQTADVNAARPEGAGLKGLFRVFRFVWCVFSVSNSSYSSTFYVCYFAPSKNLRSAQKVDLLGREVKPALRGAFENRAGASAHAQSAGAQSG